MAKDRNRAPGQRRSRRATRRVYLAGAALALGVVCLVILFGTLSRGGDGGNIGAAVVVPAARPAAVARDGLVYGSPGAAVTITEYLDFQ